MRQIAPQQCFTPSQSLLVPRASSGSVVLATAFAVWLLGTGCWQFLGASSSRAFAVAAFLVSIGTLALMLVSRRYGASVQRSSHTTGIGDRDELACEISRAVRHAEFGATAGLITVDVQRLEAVKPGEMDALMSLIGMRLRANVRRGDCVTRLSGPRFCILQTLVRSRSECDALAERFRGILSEPFLIDGTSHFPSCRVTVRMIVDGEADVRSCLAAVDWAESSFSGTTPTSVVYTEPHYIPILDLKANRVVGCDALACVTSSAGLRRACCDAATWPADVRLAIRVSRSFAEAPTFTDFVRSALDDARLCANRLEIDCDEETAEVASDRLIGGLSMLRGLGVQIGICDFGGAHSSLRTLTTVPFDRLRLHASAFGSSCGSEQTPLVRSIIGAAQAIGVPVTATGVERIQQLDIAWSLHCSEISGTVLAKPLASSAIEHDRVEEDCRARLLGLVT